MSLERKKRLGLLVILVVFLVLLVSLAFFVHHRWRYAVTNAVFVETDHLVYLGFQNVSGRLLKVTKDEGEKVRKGELLALLDERPWKEKLRQFQARKEALEAQEKALEITVSRLRRQVALEEEKVKQELRRIEAEREALLAQAKAIEAEVAQLERDQKRFQDLYQRRLIAKRKFEEIETALHAQREKQKALLLKAKALLAAKERAKKDLALARNQRKLVAEKEKELLQIRRQIKALSAAVAEARLNLSFCRLYAPFEGLVAKRFHVSGDVVAPGEPVYALVDPKDLYVLVLLEETKLHGVEPGSYAKVTLDAFPNETFEGEVAEILPATAAKFALVPRDVSAGEFTKVVQRVPVKIRLTKGPKELLRVGLGGEVEIRRK